jgi:hypothetical protein
MTKGKDNKNRASQKGSFFDPKFETDQILNIMDLGGVDFPLWHIEKDVAEVIESTIRRAYRHGRMDAIFDRMERNK